MTEVTGPEKEDDRGINPSGPREFDSLKYKQN
jgi:hypothetical protein